MFPLHTTVLTRNLPLVSWVIIALNALVFLFELRLSPEQLDSFCELFGLVPARFTHPGWAAGVGFPAHGYWTFLTSSLMHGGWLHLLGNMWTLWVFGKDVEDRMGHGRFLGFYLVCTLAAGMMHVVANAESTVPVIGASGAIAGVMGAYLFLFPRARVLILIPIFFFPFIFEIHATFFLIYWFVLQVLGGMEIFTAAGAAGGVAFWAHIGGFCAGALLWVFFLKPRSRRDRYHDDEGGFRHAWSHDSLLFPGRER